METANIGDVVKVHYKARTNDETIFDSSTSQPLEVTIGNQQVFPDFEKALIGMKIGDQKNIFLDAEHSFGPYLQELISTVDRKQIPANIELKIGQKLAIQQEKSYPIIVTVIHLSKEHVTLDANHPLAGKDLTFEISLLDLNKKKSPCI